MKTPLSRIAALTVIAVVVAGLTYLRVDPGPSPVSVPAGAKAGTVSLHPCGTRTDCGALVVPENRADPHSRLIALPVTRIRAASDHPGPPIFRLNGGPGLSNMTFKTADDFTDQHDVVLVGYRGVDGSSRLECPEVTAALEHSTDFLSEASFHGYADGFRACAARFTRAGVDLAGYSLPGQVDDFEAARVALGYGPIDLLSESAGTRTAMVYAWRYPASIHRSVMIGVNPPGHFRWDPATTDELLKHYADLCGQDAACRKRTDDLAASMRRTASQLPDRWLFLPIKKGDVRVASFFGLFDSTSAGGISAPMTLDSWLAAADGDPSGFWFMSLAAGLIFPSSFVWGEFAAIGAADAHVSPAAMPSDSILGDPGTAFTWGGGLLADAWPAGPDQNAYSRVQTSQVPTLLIGGTLDFSTPARVATDELLPYLPNGHQVVLAELGHVPDFWAYEPAAGSHLINTFLDSGRVDDSLYHHATVDFTPAVPLPALAKIVVGTMIGLALLAVLSLLLSARKVYRRRVFGRRTSAVMRSLYPLVLGLGGWCLGALVVLTVLPAVPLDDELLTVASVGLPIGLGVSFAWTNGGRPTARDLSMTLCTVGGALLGAWLGFHATQGIGALITAIAGAIVGANLVLLAVDITGDRSRSRHAVTDGGAVHRTP